MLMENLSLTSLAFKLALNYIWKPQTVNTILEFDGKQLSHGAKLFKISEYVSTWGIPVENSG